MAEPAALLNPGVASGVGSADSSLLFRSRVLLLTGKGGTGKTTLAAATARFAAAQGRKTLLCELDNQRPSLTAIFGKVPTYEPQRVESGAPTGPGSRAAAALSICNIEWMPALDDWLADLVGVGRIVRMIMKNRMISIFLEAAPGARDLMLLHRVVRLAEQFDLVVVDMPASGNAAGMLSVVSTARRLFDSGPIRRCAEEIDAMLRRPDTNLVVVSLPEEMVVNETMETRARIAAEVPGLRQPLVLLNRATPASLTPGEQELLSRLDQADVGSEARELVEAGLWEERLERATAEALTRLRGDAGRSGPSVVVLPVLGRGEGAAKVVGQLTAALARQSRARVDLVGDVAR